MLSKEFIDECKKKLISDEDRLEKDLKGLTEGDFGHDVGDEEDKGVETEKIEDNEGVASEFSARLVDIDAALQKIEEGVYGTCENCHKEISEKLLRVAPESRLCETCKESIK